MQSTLPYSLYIHIPFCHHRCGYCDFNTYAGLELLIPSYVEALCAEIRFLARSVVECLEIQTIYFGGGTPSLLSTGQLKKILCEIESSFDLIDPIEITLEANPGTLSPDYLQEIHSLGINRLSLGVQSAHPSELRLLERQHDYRDVIQSVLWSRQAGFSNLNLDLIFGLPEQEPDTWQQTLKLVTGLNPEHLSLYALSLEHGTPFGHYARRGLLSPPDPDRSAEMYEWASEYLSRIGYAQYEISNWALSSVSDLSAPELPPDSACRHNLQYWRNLPYLGIGAGAHGYAANTRTANLLSPAHYCHRLLSAGSPPQPDPKHFPRTPATHQLQHLDVQAEISDTMMMGLRLTREGVSMTEFKNRFGLPLEELFGPQINHFIELGLLEWLNIPPDQRLRLTSRGRLLGNQVFMEFI